MPLFQFQAQSSSSYALEDFLRDAQSTGIADPGSAMVDVLRRKRVPGLNLDKILSTSCLNPCSAPENLLAFLRHICKDGSWGVNLRVNID